jgi:hypothetical protein
MEFANGQTDILVVELLDMKRVMEVHDVLLTVPIQYE